MSENSIASRVDSPPLISVFRHRASVVWLILMLATGLLWWLGVDHDVLQFKSSRYLVSALRTLLEAGSYPVSGS